jgi:hypothetical protein
MSLKNNFLLSNLKKKINYFDDLPLQIAKEKEKRKEVKKFRKRFGKGPEIRVAFSQAKSNLRKGSYICSYRTRLFALFLC